MSTPNPLVKEGSPVRRFQELNMPDERIIGDTALRLKIGDVTNQEIDAFVYYAQHDLKLGSGFGTAISSRGGPTIQKELNEIGPLETY